MNNSIFIKLEAISQRCKELETLLSSETINLNQEKFLLLSKEYLTVLEINNHFEDWRKEKENIKELKNLLKDHELYNLAKEEIHISEIKIKKLEKKIKVLLLPEDPNDKLSCFIEIRAATGGEEAALFAEELFKMYVKYAEFSNWSVDLMHCNLSDHGGYKEVIAKIKGKNVCRRLKFESGGHRVQRIPKTESQGRLHTSTCTVAVMPDLPIINKHKIQIKDLKIDTFRSSGAGGQHVNTTDSAIRITHLPTGIVVECQDERSQHKNKSKALSVLKDRIHSFELSKIHKKESLIRKNLLGTGDRSDRNRTYNFPQNRVTDHRINLTIYALDEILEGKLNLLIEPILQEYQAEQLASISKVN